MSDTIFTLTGFKSTHQAYFTGQTGSENCVDLLLIEERSCMGLSHVGMKTESLCHYILFHILSIYTSNYYLLYSLNCIIFFYNNLPLSHYNIFMLEVWERKPVCLLLKLRRCNVD